MPEIGECYTIADKIPEMGTVTDVTTSAKFYKYINLDKSFKKIPEDLNIGKPFAYGKSIWFPISTKDKKGYIISQLGMTGSWFLNESGRDKKNDHLVFTNKETVLRYSDPRMFGKLRVYLYDKQKADEEIRLEIIKKYKWGIDPHLASNQELLRAIKKWSKSSKNIKTLMLDQNIVFGLGNYLCSEILFDSKINPLTLGSDLTDHNLLALVKSIKKVVKIAIKTGGFSFAAGYYHPDGSVGSMVKFIKVYEREGLPCKTCKGLIFKDFINTRSTYWCLKCQKNRYLRFRFIPI